MALAVVPTAALVMAGTHALDSALDERRPFVADRANGPVVVGPDGVPDAQQRRPPVDGEPLLPASAVAGPPSPGPSSAGSGAAGSGGAVPESTRSPVTEACTGEHVGSAGSPGSPAPGGPPSPGGSPAPGGSGAGGPAPGPTGSPAPAGTPAPAPGQPSPGSSPSPDPTAAGGPPPAPSPSGTQESGGTGGGFDLNLGIIHIHVG